jgi:hypothetical protein
VNPTGPGITCRFIGRQLNLRQLEEQRGVDEGRQARQRQHGTHWRHGWPLLRQGCPCIYGQSQEHCAQQRGEQPRSGAFHRGLTLVRVNSGQFGVRPGQVMGQFGSETGPARTCPIARKRSRRAQRQTNRPTGRSRPRKPSGGRRRARGTRASKALTCSGSAPKWETRITDARRELDRIERGAF